MALSWVACEARTGRLITDLPLLDVKRVSSILGTYTTTTATLPIPGAPADWVRATEPEATFLILMDDSVSVIEPALVWGGRVTQRRRGLDDVVTLSLASFESYLDRRYVGDVTYTGTEQSAIVADLVDRYVQDGSTPLEVAVGAVGAFRDREYKDASDKTVLAALQELAGVDGGPEFTVSWRWDLSDPDVRRIVPVLTVGARIGTPAPDGLDPAATFHAPGAVVHAELLEDWSTGHGATDVMASSSGVGDARPQSPRQVATDLDRPTIEYRFTPSTSITEVSTLTEHARRVLAAMRGGGKALSLTAVSSWGPRLGIDWFLGDDVGYQIGGLVPSPERVLLTDGFSDEFSATFGDAMAVPRYPRGVESVPGFPGGLTGVARCIGWELDLAEPATVTPILDLGGLS